jgi:pyrroloquinoline quinone biosynthesis protein B
MKYHVFLLFTFAIFACETNDRNQATEQIEDEQDSLSVHSETEEVQKIDVPSLVILGTAQDAGSPQINCYKDCCKDLHNHPDPDRMVVSLGLIDPDNNQKIIFEATPDFPRQLHELQKYCTSQRDDVPDGIFLTHAHIGHYTGLMHLGKEAMDAQNVPVYGTQSMCDFLTKNGPWSQLVINQNIKLAQIYEEQAIIISNQIEVIPFLVPHRDEYTNTVGYRIIGPNKSALFIPDIDKWNKWDKNISDEIKKVDYAFIDATFYDGEEINNRDISNIPHPFVIESMKSLEDLSEMDKSKVIFIHFNHTNPLLNRGSNAYQEVISSGFKVAEKGQVYSL